MRLRTCAKTRKVAEASADPSLLTVDLTRTSSITAVRFRRWLRIKHKFSRRKGGTHPPSYLYAHFGLVLPTALGRDAAMSAASIVSSPNISRITCMQEVRSYGSVLA